MPKYNPTQEIELNLLVFDESNVRKIDPGDVAHQELMTSIRSHGLLENLIVRPVELDQGSRFAVVGGARRLQALLSLADAGEIAENVPIPCVVVDAEADAAEISLAENAVRIALHPVDQIRAFRTLADKGSTARQIAARFGVPEVSVLKLLRLSAVSPVVLDAYKEGGISQDMLAAFTVSEDHALQESVLERVRTQPYGMSEWTVRQLLTEEKVSAGTALAIFVGLDAYREAGGEVLEDLFSAEDRHSAYIEDAGLLNRLALEKLQEVADEYKEAGGFAWTEARLEFTYQDDMTFAHVSRQPGKLTKKEAAEQGKLAERITELENLMEEDGDEALRDEYRAGNRRLHELERKVESGGPFLPEHLAICGAIVTVGVRGQAHVIEGLVRPEDIPEGMTAREAWAVFRRLIEKTAARVEIVEDIGTGMTRTWCVRAATQGERKPWTK